MVIVHFLDRRIRDGSKNEYKKSKSTKSLRLEGSEMVSAREEKLAGWPELGGGVGRGDTRFCYFMFDFKESFRPDVR